MDWGVVVGVVGAVIGVVGVLAARRYGTRRRKVLFEWTASPLVPAAERDTSSRLTVSYRDFEVVDPYLLTIRLMNVGPADVASQHFDAGQPFTVDMGCRMYGLLAKPTGDLMTATDAVGAPGFLRVGPGLLARGKEYAVQIVVSGKPELSFSAPLVDTDVLEPPQLRAQVAGSLALAVLRSVAWAIIPGFQSLDAALESRRSARPGGQLGNL